MTKLLATSSEVKIVNTVPIGTMIKPKNKLQPGIFESRMTIPPVSKESERRVMQMDLVICVPSREFFIIVNLL